MALKLRASDEEGIVLPKSVLEQLALEEGDSVQIRVDSANRLILRRETDKLSELRRFRGIWRDEDVEEVFQDID